MDRTATIQRLVKLIRFGSSAISAIIAPGPVTISGFLASGLDAYGETEGKKDTDALSALQCDLITESFGQALRRQAEASEKEVREIERRVGNVVNALRKPGDLPAGDQELRLVNSLTGDPRATRYYRTLWKEFVATSPEQPAVKLIDLEDGGQLKFERHFLTAYQAGLASPQNQSLKQYLDALPGIYLPEALGESLLRDLANWGERHVFGNIKRATHSRRDPVQFLPLDEMYVEPRAIPMGEHSEAPVSEHIKRLVRDPKKNVVVVTADFGMGKSLTARRLAQQWARDFLNGRETSLESWLPIFIRGSSDLDGQAFDLEQTVRRARMQQADDALDMKMNVKDPALGFPAAQQRTVFLIDGLDEVALDEEDMIRLFKTINDAATARHRFIIFSRPGALPSTKIFKNISVLEIRAWRPEQVEQWLKRWTQLTSETGPTYQQIQDRGLGELSVTPILLFMVAQAWKTLPAEGQPNRAWLYEQFFQSIARGKHDADEDHPVVGKASEDLCLQLRKQKLLDTRDPVQAMLWLMSRVAWEVTRREQARKFRFSTKSSEPLTKDDFVTLLQDELRFQNNQTAGTLKVIQDGLLLAMQVHLHRDGASQFLFGQKSFREFLVARYWADRLKALAREQDFDGRTALEDSLLGGRLLVREDRTFTFLLEMINDDSHGHQDVFWRLADKERDNLLKWAQDCFASPKSHSVTLKEDMRPMLREAALALVSELKGSSGAWIQDELTLRSLFAWFWLMRIGPIVIAPKAQFQKSILAELNLRGANFRGADLSGAILTGASMLVRRDNSTESCDFSGANLSEAKLDNAGLQRALFVGACLNGATLDHANLEKANCKGAQFKGASLALVSLKGVNLDDAILDDANLLGANLEGASLKRASLRDADLNDAFMEDLDLSETDLHGATYTRDTSWPEGFDPEAAGAIFRDYGDE